jgi:hypothetical protein
MGDAWRGAALRTGLPLRPAHLDIKINARTAAGVRPTRPMTGSHQYTPEIDAARAAPPFALFLHPVASFLAVSRGFVKHEQVR